MKTGKKKGIKEKRKVAKSLNKTKQKKSDCGKEEEKRRKKYSKEDKRIVTNMFREKKFFLWRRKTKENRV